MRDLPDLTATEALAAFADRSLSPVDLTAALIDRAAADNPAVNALADRYHDDAMTQARAAEARWRDGTARRLEGLPVLVKDSQRIAGRRTTFGSLLHMDSVDAVSDPMPERLLAAGAICLARTTTPEFCLLGVTYSRAWGVTRNPFDLSLTPGGSSGGSAAAVACGMAPVATGTDIGGSVRIPAACCGLVGYMPPRGRNPHGYPANLDPFDHCGPITRSVQDAALMQAVTAGPHPADLFSLRDTPDLPDAPGAVAGMRVALSMDLGLYRVDPGVRANTLAFADTLRAMGCTVEEVDTGWGPWIEADAMRWYGAMHMARSLIPLAEAQGDRMTDYARSFADLARATTADDGPRAWDGVQRMYSTLAPLLQRFDALVCPTNALPAVPADQDPLTATLMIDGAPVHPENGWVMTWPFNMLSVLPVMTVPTGRVRGVPTGAQIVGRSYDDATVFRLALAWQAAAPGMFLRRTVRPGAV
jgi:amidase